MKKKLITAFLVVIALFSFAQPEFTANNCFQVNDSSKLGFAIVPQPFMSYVSQTGTDYTWDFTSTGTPGPWTSWTAPTVSYQFQPAAKSIHSLFINSEINEYASVAFARDHFYTYSANKDTLYADGFYAGANSTYSPRIPYLSFPLKFRDSIFTNTKQKIGNVEFGSVSRSWIYDGFGKVKLPYGTENNVYRIRTVQIDSSYILHSAAVSEEIIWFRQSDGIPLLRFTKQGETSISVYYAASSGSVAGLKNNLVGELKLFPNPFSDAVHLWNNSNQTIEQLSVYDMQGRKIIQLNGNVAGSINTSELGAGLYLFEITFADQSVIHRTLSKVNSLK